VAVRLAAVRLAGMAPDPDRGRAADPAHLVPHHSPAQSGTIRARSRVKCLPFDEIHALSPGADWVAYAVAEADATVLRTSSAQTPGLLVGAK
jgi:hypothetical protein